MEMERSGVTHWLVSQWDLSIKVHIETLKIVLYVQR